VKNKTYKEKTNAYAAEIVENVDPDGFAPTTYTLVGIEVFRAGTWTDSAGVTTTYTVDDLQAMADNSRKDGIPLKCGHCDSDSEKFDCEFPAIGWVEKLRVKGESLWSDFTALDAYWVGQIKAKKYRKRSAEIIFTENGPELWAVALLGESQSALPLEDCFSAKQKPDGTNVISAHSYSVNSIFEIKDDGSNDKFSNETKRGDNYMNTVEATSESIATYKSEIATHTAKISALETQVSEHAKAAETARAQVAEYSKMLATANDALKAAEGEIAELKTEAKKAEMNSFFAANSKKVQPFEVEALKMAYSALMADEEKLNAFRASIEARAEHAAFKDDSGANGTDANSDEANGDDIMAKIKAYAKEHGLDLSKRDDYRTAYAAMEYVKPEPKF
jgi:hypothetical protein